MKKKLIIILLIFLLLGSTSFVIYYIKCSKKNKDYVKFNNDYKRTEYINDFIKKEQGQENKDVEGKAGYNGIFINNKQELLKCMNIDGMLSVNAMLMDAFRYIPQIYKDSLKFKNDDDINKFLNKNNIIISGDFGINDISSFKNFISKLIFLKDNQKLREASISDCKITDSYGNYDEIHFNLVLKTLNNSQTFDIKFVLQKDNQKNNKLIYWN